MSGQGARSAQAMRSSFGRRILSRARAEVRLTALAIWRGGTGLYNSEDLTFASSIAYYALLSLFPFFLLALSILGGVAGPMPTARRSSISC